jgi:hypothetical protein
MVSHSGEAVEKGLGEVQVTEGYETTVACDAPATSPAPLGMEEMGAPGYH